MRQPVRIKIFEIRAGFQTTVILRAISKNFWFHYILSLRMAQVFLKAPSQNRNLKNFGGTPLDEKINFNSPSGGCSDPGSLEPASA